MVEHRPSRRSGGLTAVFLLVVAGVLFVSLNVVVGKLIIGARLDLTEDKLFTLSDGTRDILAALEEPVTLEFYFSERVAAPYPQLFRYGNRVRDLLLEIEREGGDKIDLRLANPAPFSEAEDAAVGAGLQGVPTSSGDALYLGLVATDTTDKRTVMPFLSTDREAFLEYDIVKTIFALSQSAKPRLALLTSLPMQYGPDGIMAYLQGQGRPYVIYQQLEQFFEIVIVDAAFEALPDGIEAFLIVHPPVLGVNQLYAIDQYVLGGGRALIFVDPFAEESAVLMSRPVTGGLPPETVPVTSSLEPLLAAWGLDYDSGLVVADLEIAQRVNVGGERGIRDYIVWLAVTNDNLNADDIVSGAVSSVNLATSGALALREAATTTLTPLVTSSVVSSLIPVDALRDEPDPDDLIRDMVPDDAVHTLIGRVTGPAMSAFRDGPPEGAAPGELDDMSGGAHLAASEGPINIVVGADVDMFADRFWVQVQNYLGQSVATPIADNGAFIVSAVDHMIGSDALISLRSRRISQRPFHAVDKIRRRAEARFLDEEKRLQDKLTTTELRLSEMQSAQESGTELLSLEQEVEVENFRSEMLATRQQLREVQRNLRREIDALGTWITVINVISVPLVLILLWLGVTLRRSWYRN